MLNVPNEHLFRLWWIPVEYPGIKLQLSRPLVLGFGSQTEGVLGPIDSLGRCLIEVEVEVWLQIIPEPDCTNLVVLANLVLLELHQPSLL